MTGQAELIAFYELTQAKARYCRTLDTKDWDGLAALMTDDVEFGMVDGNSEPQMTVGRDETLALLPSLVAGSKTAHHVHAPEIDLQDDEAQVIGRCRTEPCSTTAYQSPATGTTQKDGCAKDMIGSSHPCC